MQFLISPVLAVACCCKAIVTSMSVALPYVFASFLLKLRANHSSMVRHSFLMCSAGFALLCFEPRQRKRVEACRKKIKKMNSCVAFAEHRFDVGKR